MSFVVGILVGLTSMGGAALMTPFLVLVAGMRPLLAVGTDLAYGAVTKIVGAWMHWKQGTVDIKVALQLACGSVPGGIIGFLTIGYCRHHGVNPEEYVRRAIGVVLVIGAVMMIYRALKGPLLETKSNFIKRHAIAATVAWGALIGVAVGVTSVGSGSLIAPFLIMLYPNSPSRVVGTDVFHAAILVSATGMLQAKAGNVEWPLVPILLAGSVPGVLVGSFLAPRLPARPLRMGLGLLLFATGVKLV